MKKLKKEMMGILGGGIIAGVGSQVATQAGSHETAEALGNMSSFYPALGSIYGAKATLKALKKVKV